MTRIYGEAALDAVPAAIDNATLFLRVEDCTRADACALTIVEHRIAGISRAAGNTDPVQFALMLPAPPAGPGWTLRASLCQDPSGNLRQGDYVSNRRYAVGGSAAGRPLRIMLHRLA
ncbi:hypothetical protein [Noviherbaspirillum aridicola]|uniref:Lipoprotein n=1 Tax=Noviherbaspirillum aridicola TaxID=2849687 RepID=A0ABQ4Q6J9_9BURK|nr:hypothetical protein [Noviherbaspirillum aridicola]GIZ52838.1 hypothetical protein NCCP691_28520 [Noviherbaspirillum aridicola]